MAEIKFEENITISTAEHIKFQIGKTEHKVRANDVGPTVTLNSYLRDVLHLKGTKQMCYEGGCGTCIVAIERTVRGNNEMLAVNSCLVPILACDGWKVHTNEGIGNSLIGYHNIQKLLAANNGTQCGFCSSGMVMNMYALQNSGPITKAQIETAFGGNLCRCTGYRPILEAFKKLASDASYVPDIEELQSCNKENCKKDCPKCPNNFNDFCLELTDAKWIKVNDLINLLGILRTSNTDNYMLVAGNTARGVYWPATLPDLYVDVSSVTELISFKFSNNTLTLGGNITLTDTIKICDSLSKKSGFAYLGQVRDHLQQVAHIPVRNIGTLAGNLMTKYQHNEFQSDIFLLLVTFKASLVIVDVNGTEKTVSVEQFLDIKINKRIIKTIILTAINDSYKYFTYKITPRAQNAHAIVNAGFLVGISNNIATECRIVYGGINPKFIRASKTEALLQGQTLYDNTTLKKVFQSLDKEIICDYIPPDNTAEYRKNLAISLFYKFVLKTAPANLITPKNASGGTLIERPVSTGIQSFGTQKDLWPLSEPVIKLEALAQTSGQAEYVGDLPDHFNQLFGALVAAETTPGSTIQSIDISKAMEMDGVEAFYDHNSIIGENNIQPQSAGFPGAETLFCSGTVKFYSQPVGIVVAKSQSLALEAAEKIKIYYSSPKDKPLLNIQDVLEAKATGRITHLTTVVASKKGTDIKHVIKGTWYSKQQYHFHMETQCCQVIPKEDSLDIYPSTQWMDMTQCAVSNVLSIPMSEVNMYVRRLGGGFGGKLSRNAIVTVAAALAAYKLKKPVRMSLPLETNMRSIGKRYPLYVSYEVGVNDSGVIQYMEADLYTDYGLSSNEPVDFLIIPMFENCYDYSTWNFSYYTVQTDMPPNTIMRAPGTLEGLGCIEGIMEHIASVVNMDAINVKLNNTNKTKYPKIPEFWNTMQSWGEIEKRNEACKTFNSANRWKKKGMSIVPMSWLLEVRGVYPVLVSIYHLDGTVVVTHGGIEMGQGINTKVAQVTANKFGISLDKVKVKPSYNVVVPNSSPSAFSLTSEAVAYGTIQACDQLLARMKPTRDKLNNPTWVELVNACYTANILLSGSGYYSPSQPSIQDYPIFGLCAADVEVDILTGQMQIDRVDIIEDVGNSMSPLIDIGQVEGAFVMGIGYYTTENIIYNSDGKLLTDRTWTYKPPGARDIPVNFRIMFPENNPNPNGILKSKETESLNEFLLQVNDAENVLCVGTDASKVELLAVAEPPVCLSASIPLAIRNAVASARTDANSTADKWFKFDGPTTTEYTFLNSMNSFDQYTL